MTDRLAIEQRAAVWVMRRHEPEWTASDESDLTAWLQGSAAHQAAFWRLEHGYGLTFQDSDIVSDSTSERRQRRKYFKFIGFSAALSAIAASLVFLFPFASAPVPQSVEHHTRVGEIASMTLEDGSVLSLDTDTRIRILQDDESRKLWLDEGRIFIVVAKDRSRPFITIAGAAKITAVGTQFSVTRDVQHTAVSVVEGAVKLDSSLYPSAGETILKAAQTARTDGKATFITVSDGQSITDEMAWRNGAVTFDNTRLADAAANFNRYNKRKLRVLGSAADLRIGGTFQLGNISGFSQVLASAYHLQIHSGPDEIIISDN